MGKGLALLASLALITTTPALAQAGSGQNQAVHHWNTRAFSVHPPANTRAFSVHPPANTNAFSKTPASNNRAFGNANGRVTAFGNGTNAFGNQVTGSHNARRLANAFGTGTDHNASPMGPSHSVQSGGGR